VIRLNPKSDVAYMRRSEAWLKKGDNMSALRDADQAVALDSGDPANFINRGAVMRELGRNNDAILDYRKALSLKPDDVRRKQAEQALLDLGVQP
jgi:tetratricopeptide (TPR) repeat protein